MGKDEVNSQEITGALELLFELLVLHPDLDEKAPLMQTWGDGGWKMITRHGATATLRHLASCAGQDPWHYGLYSGRI